MGKNRKKSFIRPAFLERLVTLSCYAKGNMANNDDCTVYKVFLDNGTK